MGPRLLCRGNPESGCSSWLRWSRFNGATAVMPWKCRRHISDAVQVFRFNGATAVMPWKCSAGVVPPGEVRTGFNGATAVMPWKSRLRELSTDFGLEASMGPRLLCRGNDDGDIGRGRPDRLQWGHGCYAVEIPTLPEAGTPAGDMLQWGHGCYAVEIRQTAVAVAVNGGRLQWGHGCYAVEIHNDQIGQQTRQLASMGPRLLCRGNPRRRNVVTASWQCFNGATAVMPWKCCFPIWGGRYWSCFNGATAVMPWK